MNDYEDLAFKPALSWEDFCEYAWSKNVYPYTKVVAQPYIEIEDITFWKDHTISACGVEIAKDRTYEQMKTIFDALTEKNDER